MTKHNLRREAQFKFDSTPYGVALGLTLAAIWAKLFFSATWSWWWVWLPIAVPVGIAGTAILCMAVYWWVTGK